jgi:hypothetical protein
VKTIFLRLLRLCDFSPLKLTSGDSEARVVELDEESRLPPDALSDGFEYFLETFVALEVLEGLRNRRILSTEDACNLILYYAENDAYPEWANK